MVYNAAGRAFGCGSKGLGALGEAGFRASFRQFWTYVWQFWTALHATVLLLLQSFQQFWAHFTRVAPPILAPGSSRMTFLPHVSASRFCLFFGLIPDRIRHSIARVACGSLPLTLAPGQPPRPQPPREQVIFNPNSRENHHFPTEHLMFTPSTQAICIQNVPKKCYRAGVLVLCTARVDKHLQHSVDLQGCF